MISPDTGKRRFITAANREVEHPQISLLLAEWWRPIRVRGGDEVEVELTLLHRGGIFPLRGVAATLLGDADVILPLGFLERG